MSNINNISLLYFILVATVIQCADRDKADQEKKVYFHYPSGTFSSQKTGSSKRNSSITHSSSSSTSDTSPAVTTSLNTQQTQTTTPPLSTDAYSPTSTSPTYPQSKPLLSPATLPFPRKDQVSKTLDGIQSKFRYQQLIQRAGSTDTQKEKDKTLSLAILTGQNELVKRLLENKANPSSHFTRNFSKLALAASLNEPTIVKTLLDANAELGNDNPNNALTIALTALNRAKSRKAIYCIRDEILYQYEIEPDNFPVKNIPTENHTPTIRLLLESKINNFHHILPRMSHLEAKEDVKLLLDYKANPNVLCSEFNNPPLLLATLAGNKPIAKMLIQAKADVNFYHKNNKYSAINVAARKGDVEIIKLLTEHKADLTRGNPLKEAVMSKQSKAIKYLLENSTANPDAILHELQSNKHSLYNPLKRLSNSNTCNILMRENQKLIDENKAKFNRQRKLIHYIVIEKKLLPQIVARIVMGYFHETLPHYIEKVKQEICKDLTKKEKPKKRRKNKKIDQCAIC